MYEHILIRIIYSIKIQIMTIIHIATLLGGTGVGFKRHIFYIHFIEGGGYTN